MHKFNHLLFKQYNKLASTATSSATEANCQVGSGEESTAAAASQSRKKHKLGPGGAEPQREEQVKPTRKRKHEEVAEKDAEMFGRFAHPPPDLKISIRNDVRYLSPYWGCFRGFAKSRWIGRCLGEVFSTEFIGYHPLYPKAAIRLGRVFINSRQQTDPDYRFRESDRFAHINHRHESEIPALPIQFIGETDDFLVINKPPGLPVHPCGNYNIHSVMSLLKREYGREDSEKLRPLFRLDRNTTGVLMFAKNYEADLKFKNALIARQVRKEYLAKVEGIFPEGEVVCDALIGFLSLATGIRQIRPDGQEALSRFRRIYANQAENWSLVECQIETGRTHQIRVHLQFLGFPLFHDAIYNDPVWGQQKGKGADYGGKSREELIEDVYQKHSKTGWINSSDQDFDRRLAEIGDNELYQPEDMDWRALRVEELPESDPICWNCAIYEKRQLKESDWSMPLHCWRYSGDQWSFEAPLPEWAKFAKQQEEEEKPQTTTPDEASSETAAAATVLA